MKIYLYINDSTKVIMGYSEEYLAGSIEAECEDPRTIKLGLDTFEDNKIISKPIPIEALKYQRIQYLKNCLNSTDYIAIKHADGVLTDEEYEVTRLQRQAWREEIRELQGD